MNAATRQASELQGSITIIRGLPGSGKSTLAERMVANGEADIHIETDMWFTSLDGAYRFDPDKLGEYHAKCQDAAKALADQGMHVVVSNTFTRLWEIDPYRQMGVPVEIVTASGDFGNLHGVPKDAVERMRQRWEACP